MLYYSERSCLTLVKTQEEKTSFRFIVMFSSLLLLKPKISTNVCLSATPTKQTELWCSNACAVNIVKPFQVRWDDTASVKLHVHESMAVEWQRINSSLIFCSFPHIQEWRFAIVIVLSFPLANRASRGLLASFFKYMFATHPGLNSASISQQIANRLLMMHCWWIMNAYLMIFVLL